VSAQELKDAAALLRKTAAAAPPPPWRVDIHPSRKHPNIPGAAWLVMPDRKRGISLNHAGNLAEVQWQALVDPGLAGPLADLLDAVAAKWPTALVHTSTESATLVRRCALATARTINGTAS
jgi:hypothetical protein